ncbi:hypothetical protein WDW86_22130 [Bdellovibrionota bacterium FG-2]
MLKIPITYVSVLLFGQPSENLEGGDKESAGNFNSALAGRSLNLVSLYLFAATPIQSFDYNPSTGIFSAKVRLGEKTTLQVGPAGSQLASVGIRKRLGKRWAITTQLEGISERETASVTAFSSGLTDTRNTLGFRWNLR